MRKLCLLLTLIVFLSACATTKGPEPKGPDSFIVKGISDFGPESAETKALKKATEFAQSKGKIALTVDSKTEKSIDFMGDKVDINELTFKLVGDRDPEYQKAKLEQEKRNKPETKQDKTDKLNDYYNSLRELKALKDEGILTEEEFQQEKKEILDSN